MLKNLTLVLSVMIVAAPAFASRARIESLGEGKNGSYYIQDSRNIFLNPAQIVKYKKKLMLELGGTVATGNNADTAVEGTEKAQGGFTNTFGDFTYGLYLNNNRDALQNQAATLTGAVNPESQIDLFFAGEGSLAWGINVFYAGNNVKTAGVDSNANALGARVGIDMNNFQVFSTFDILGKSKIENGAANGNELKTKFSYDAGATYGMDNWTVFAKYSNFGQDLNTVVTAESRASNLGLGAGYKHEATKSTTMYARVEADLSSTKPITASATGVETKSYNVPVVLAAESQALSWLAVRGSIAHSLLGQQWAANTRTSFAGSTTVSAGLGLTFGDVQIDGLVATGTTSPTNNGAAGFGTAPQSNGTFGFGDSMLSRLALTYNF